MSLFSVRVLCARPALMKECQMAFRDEPKRSASAFHHDARQGCRMVALHACALSCVASLVVTFRFVFVLLSVFSSSAESVCVRVLSGPWLLRGPGF